MNLLSVSTQYISHFTLISSCFLLPYTGLGAVHYEKDEVAKAEKKKQLIEGKFEEFYLTRLDKIAADNNGHFAIKKATWADLWFMGTCDYMAWMAGKSLDEFIGKYPNVKKVHANMSANANIKKWLATRPKSMDL